jgi:protoporphyrinogen/coproporphyrinogen III oxidase
VNHVEFPLRIAVVGAGISGLAAAHRLQELSPHAQVSLFEAKDRAGGILETIRVGDYLIERSADMFTTREPWALDLARRVGLENELLNTNEANRKALIVSRGRLHPVPEGFTLMSPTKIWPIATSPLLSWSGKLRMAWEWFVKAKRDDQDESLADFTRRRLGNEAFERLVQPLVGGIYTADPEKLSMASTMPQFVEMEKKFGGLLRGMLRTKEKADVKETHSGVRYGQFVAPRLGMQQFIEAIVSRLTPGTLRLQTEITQIERMENQAWKLTLRSGETETFHGLIYALPGSTSSLLTSIDQPLTELVQHIPRAGCSVVVCGFKRAAISHSLNAFGFVVPAVEKRQIIAGSFASNKFPGRAPEDRILIRVFIGGALQPELAELPDGDLIATALRELNSLLGVRGDPEVCQVVRWLGAMPQYHVGHGAIATQIEARAATIPRFALAGNLYRGVGIPFCVRSGEQAAETLLAKCLET